MTLSDSPDASKAYALVTGLQSRFAQKLNQLSKDMGEDKEFEEVSWLRDKGEHGGGSRFEARDEKLFNTGSINISQVHYNKTENKNLLCATAISTIIHPRNPHVPSVHIHISLTQLQNGESYWRLMADLNPSIFHENDKKIFDAMLKDTTNTRFKEGILQGNKYFNIPALKRHRGVSHFYLENYKTESKEDDFTFAQDFGEKVIDTYIEIITDALSTRLSCSSRDIAMQLKYHTLYLFQVLTLDRGTTSGLLIHNQNDLGIMGSLPAYVDRTLLHSWAKNVPAPQDELVRELADAINLEGKIDSPTKIQLAYIVREHYKKHPDAIELQASGNTVPATVENHSTIF
ncbi:MAG: coproporphyrinogen III oxidase [Campylobacterales bacterium]|nr:coproporphyrinogen III oxidase [Campylobacterales bacterium]